MDQQIIQNHTHRLEKWENDMTRFETEVAALDESKQTPYQHAISGLKANLQQARKHLTTLENAPAADWENQNEQFEQTMAAAEKSYQQVAQLGSEQLGWAEGMAHHREHDSKGWAEGMADHREHDSDGWAEGMRQQNDA